MFVGLILSVLIITGCEGFKQRHDAQMRAIAQKHNSSPAYADGFVDGCNSSYSTARFKKETERYINDKYYHAGWDDGHMHCSKKETERKETAEALGELSRTIGSLGN